MADNKPTPNAIDIHVGERLRRLRSLKNITQQALGEALGISFQQVQKYEKGTNRISASKMFEIMQMFGSSADYFFNGLHKENLQVDGFDEAPTPKYKIECDSADELLAAFNAIGNAAMRKQILELVKVIADDQR